MFKTALTKEFDKMQKATNTQHFFTAIFHNIIV